MDIPREQEREATSEIEELQAMDSPEKKEDKVAGATLNRYHVVTPRFTLALRDALYGPAVANEVSSCQAVTQ
jgi:hypothetical protein